jgi:lysophospholipase L1-like esterase
MRRFVFIAALLTLLTAAMPAGASSGEDPVHLGVGDSVAFGFGTERPEQHGYTAVVSRWARGIDCREGNPSGCPRLELVNMAVPGATSASLISGQLPAAAQLISTRNNDADPGNDVVLITVTIGGNDLFSPVVGACSGGVTPECVEVITEGLTTYAQNLGLILGTLRQAAGPDARIVIMTYYNPLGSCFLADLEPLADNVLEGGPGVPFGLNDIIRATAAATDVEVAETFGALDGDDFVGGQDCLHPDKSGYHAIAKAFMDTLR